MEPPFVVLEAAACGRPPCCPDCGDRGRRVHSTYWRMLAELPLAGQKLSVRLRVRRFFCERERCERRTFVEQIAGLSERRRRSDWQARYPDLDEEEYAALYEKVRTARQRRGPRALRAGEDAYPQELEGGASVHGSVPGRVEPVTKEITLSLSVRDAGIGIAEIKTQTRRAPARPRRRPRRAAVRCPGRAVQGDDGALVAVALARLPCGR
ncbi:transposase family protein [Streptomyces sp. KM273126]|uniref:transposase family protein n=1 Tax=Streptomyces sp. KM273126 TaxID=2545247 RepID=UPI00215D8E43|nr:transposase family protein [Streptomyces sp. KM273126]